MKKATILVLAILVVMSISSTSYCAGNEWLVGKWKGFEDRAKNIWMLEIAERDGKLNGSLMWVTETSKMGPISIISIQNNTLTFQSASKKEFVLSRVSDNRMEGKYTNSEGKEIKVRFLKEGEANASPFLGTWEGKGTGKLSNEWLVGKWYGFPTTTTITCTLEITTDVISNKDGVMELRAVYNDYNIQTKYASKSTPVIVRLQNDAISFKYTDADFTCSRANDSRIDGKVLKTKTGWQKNIRFWKDRGEANASPLLGIWEGRWLADPSLRTYYYAVDTSVEVLYIDETAMTCLYKWGDSLEMNYKAGQKYLNGEMASERKYVTHQDSDPKWEMTFLFAKGNEKISAETLYNGERRATATLKKK